MSRRESEVARFARGFALAAVLVCALALPGCLGIQRRAGGIEPLARILETGQYEELGEVEGSSSAFHLLWIFPVTPKADLERAVDDALAAKRADNLIELRWWFERHYWIVGTVSVIYVRGKAIRYISP